MRPVQMRRRAACLAAWAIAGANLAGAPAPVRPIPQSLYSGRWYDIAHTPNARQRDCKVSMSDFTGWNGRAFTLAQTCARASGAVKVLRAQARIVRGSGNARFKVAFLGGLISQEYWILDRADDGRWAILATPGGHYVWLLFSRPDPRSPRPRRRPRPHRRPRLRHRPSGRFLRTPAEIRP